jgi:rhodanese-related sulfurtransferase/type 1 glutamine amidotransferase
MKHITRFLLVSLLVSLSPFALVAAGTPRVVLISGEYEYSSMITLPALAAHLEKEHGFVATYLQRTDGEHIPGLDALKNADLAIIVIRRMTLPVEELAAFKDYLARGKPLLGLRTASHAFENWKEFDNIVLGGNYQGHHGNEIVSTARVHAPAKAHPILAGVPAGFPTGGSLYKTSPLAAGTELLLMGGIATGAQPEPMAWTHRYGQSRVFYSSLGDPADFRNPAFLRLLINAIYWSLDRPAPADMKAPATLGGQPVKKLDAANFEKLVTQRKFTTVDVRTAKEFATGHLKGAQNIDFNAPDFAQRIGELNRAKPITVHCQSGKRSAAATAKMREMGFELLYDLEGGFAAWQKAGKPVGK